MSTSSPSGPRGPSRLRSNRMLRLAACSVVATLAASARAGDVFPEWVSGLPVGSALAAGFQALVVDPAGVSYLTGIDGPGSNTDVVTAAFGPDGTLLWKATYNGPVDWSDQGRGIALSPDGGTVWVCGNTPDSMFYANVLVLGYDAPTGTLVHAFTYSSGPGTSEYGGSIAVDAAGDLYVGGGTVGDGSDGLVLKFDPAGNLLWSRTYDGPAWGPYSQDQVLKMLIGPDGSAFALIHGIMNSNHPDYVVEKYDAATGATLWLTNYGVNGGDFPRDMEIDALGDVYVTGTGIDFVDKFLTIKLNGVDGAVLWHEYDAVAIDQSANGLALDGAGGVYVTGSSDPDGDHSNFNDNFLTVKRDAATGAFLWQHVYGLNCVGCYDVAVDVVVDSANTVYVAGATSSPPYSADMITFMLDKATGVEVDRGVISGAPGWTASAGILKLDALQNLYDAGSSSNPSTGQKEMSLVKYTTRAFPIHQLAVTPIASGATATFTILDATPGLTQFLIFGVAGTATIPVPTFQVVLGIASPNLLLSGLAPASGEIATNVFVPPGLSGITVWLQGVEYASTTPVVKRTIQ